METFRMTLMVYSPDIRLFFNVCAIFIHLNLNVGFSWEIVNKIWDWRLRCTHGKMSKNNLGNDHFLKEFYNRFHKQIIWGHDKWYIIP